MLVTGGSPCDVIESNTLLALGLDSEYVCDAQYLDSVLMVVLGWSSRPWSSASRLRSHSSSLLSWENSASTAPDLVPVTTRGSEPGAQAKAAVRGISLSRTMVAAWMDRLAETVKGGRCQALALD